MAPSKGNNTAISMGTKPWPDESVTVSGADAETPEFNQSTGKFTKNIRIHSDDVFTLKPARSKGRRVLIIDDFQPFRFLDLPPDIRNMIYPYLLEEQDPIKITALPSRNGRRAVCEDFLQYKRDGYRWCRNEQRWTDQPPCNFAINTVSKQVKAETAPLIYAKNTLEFDDFSALSAFLKGIGDMRRLLKQIDVTGTRPYTIGKGRGVFRDLSTATNLKSLRISHRAIGEATGSYSGGRVSVAKFVKDAGRCLRKIYKAFRIDTAHHNHTGDILDLVQVTDSECTYCFAGLRCWEERRDTGKIECNDDGIDEHIKNLQAALKSAIAKELNIGTIES